MEIFCSALKSTNLISMRNKRLSKECFKSLQLLRGLVLAQHGLFMVNGIFNHFYRI